jgi:hypothetical protein
VNTSRRRLLWLLLAWILAVVSTLPVLFHWPAPAPHMGVDRILRLAAAYGIVAGLVCFIYARERTEGREHALRVLFLVLFATVFVNHLHSVLVEHGTNYPGLITNIQWQINLQDAVVRLDPNVLPHSYRFLPNGFVRWFQRAHIDFDAARDLYRCIFILLTFYALYRYAKFFTTTNGAFAVVLLIATIYPVSFQYYLGQLTDPMSHLSFVLAFICLELEDLPGLVTAILIGSLAKETVLAMGGYYFLTHWRGRRNLVKSGVLLALIMATYAGVRTAVLHGQLQYKQISGVNSGFIWTNLTDKHWPLVFVLTVLALSPTLIFNWNRTPWRLKGLILYLVPVLFLSSAAFSWLMESRNFMPVVFVLAVVAGRYLCGPPDDTRTSRMAGMAA